MTGLRRIAAVERSTALRALTSRYSVSTLSQLGAAFKRLHEDRTDVVYAGYQLTRATNAISLTDQATGEDTSVQVSDAHADKLDDVWDRIADYLNEHYGSILSGELKATDVGGAVFGIVGGVVGLFILPVLGDGLVSKIITTPISVIAAQKGRYFGAAVDDIASILKGEDDVRVQEIAGTLATIWFTGNYLQSLGSLVPVGGVDAWELTKEIGGTIGGAISAAIEDIVGVVGGVVPGLANDVKDVLGL